MKGTVTKRFGEKVVFQDFSFEIEEGVATRILGASGRGKTTFLRLLAGLEKPDGGDLSAFSGLTCSFCFQEDRLVEHLSAMDNIIMVTASPNKGNILRAVRRLGLPVNQPVREFSGGMKRRVALLRALFAPYDILLLDEPFEGLDADCLAECIALLTEMTKGRTVLLVSHQETGYPCQRVLAL